MNSWLWEQAMNIEDYIDKYEDAAPLPLMRKCDQCQDTFNVDELYLMTRLSDDHQLVTCEDCSDGPQVVGFVVESYTQQDTRAEGGE